MKRSWSLDALYLGFNDPNYLSDLAQCETLKDKYNTLIVTYFQNHTREIESIENYLTYQIEDTKRLRKLAAFGHLTFATNSTSQDRKSVV